MSREEIIVTLYHVFLAFIGLKGFAYLLGFGRKDRIWIIERGTYAYWKKINPKDPRLKEYFPSKYR